MQAFSAVSHELGDRDWVAAFGGDTMIPTAPDLGSVMAQVQQRCQVPLLAVVGWDEIDPHVDFAYRYASQTCGRTGRELYGGFDEDGDAVGGTAVYLKEWASMLRAV